MVPILIALYSTSISYAWFLAHICYAKSLQPCPTLCDPIDSSPPGSAVPGILQARTLEWAAISFSNAWKWRVKVKSLSHVHILKHIFLISRVYHYLPSFPFFPSPWHYHLNPNSSVILILNCIFRLPLKRLP